MPIILKDVVPECIRRPILGFVDMFPDAQSVHVCHLKTEDPQKGFDVSQFPNPGVSVPTSLRRTAVVRTISDRKIARDSYLRERCHLLICLGGAKPCGMVAQK